MGDFPPSIFFHTQNLDEAPIKANYPLVNEHTYGKSPFLMGKSTISMAIFNSFVKLPDGKFWCEITRVPMAGYQAFDPGSWCVTVGQFCDAKTSDIENWIKGPWHTLEIHENEQSLRDVLFTTFHNPPFCMRFLATLCVRLCVCVCSSILGPWHFTSDFRYMFASGALSAQKRTWFARSLMFKPVCNNDP